MNAALVVLLALAGCGEHAALRDEDGDGFTILDGDCNDHPDGGAEIGPHAAETWYDGIDQDCDGRSDYDKDGDGFDAVGYGEGTDCWDDPDIVPDAFEAVNGFDQPTAAEVNPDGAERWYDGIDADCDNASDFDQDGDGYDSANEDYGPPDGSGTDCYDSPDVDPYPGEPGADLAPEEVHPGAEEEWYDGTDADCDGGGDCDQDGDGWCVDEECDDTDPSRVPDETIAEVWYNDVDEDCDGNLYDKDGDGYESALDGPGDDCWDDDDAIRSDFVAINGFDQRSAAEVHPGAEDAPYDGIDADCARDTDFDADGDGYTTDEYADRDGNVGADCADDDPVAYPGAPEVWYNGLDDDCQGGSDYDADGDGRYASAELSTGTDCDDLDPTVYTGAPEAVADAVDQDCDGGDTCYVDDDADGYRNADTTRTIDSSDLDCDDAGEGSATEPSTDCDDASASDYPGATEVAANGDDEDCDSQETCYVDEDADGYRNEDTTLTVESTDLDCDDAGEGSSAEPATDCDDADLAVNPGAVDVAGNRRDDDCDGVIDG